MSEQLFTTIGNGSMDGYEVSACQIHDAHPLGLQNWLSEKTEQGCPIHQHKLKTWLVVLFQRRDSACTCDGSFVVATAQCGSGEEAS